MRTCIGCRQREDRSHLIRVVLSDVTDTRFVIVDEHRRLPGRGAWLHPDPDCWDAADSRRAYHRAFRTAVDSTDVKRQLHQLLDQWNLGHGSEHQQTDHESGSRDLMDTR